MRVSLGPLPVPLSTRGEGRRRILFRAGHNKVLAPPLRVRRGGWGVRVVARLARTSPRSPLHTWRGAKRDLVQSRPQQGSGSASPCAERGLGGEGRCASRSDLSPFPSPHVERGEEGSCSELATTRFWLPLSVCGEGVGG